MKKPLVSLVTPSFNGAVFLDNYFERILKQTYQNIEVVLVNNGSTDNTDKIVEQYKPLLEHKGILFKYLRVEKNSGPLKGLNLGIKNITGDFFSEIDVDDSIHDDYIEKKIDFFLNHPDVDILITPVDFYDYEDKNKAIGRVWKTPFSSKQDLINRYILSKDAGYMGGAYMMRSKTFFKTYSSHEIIVDDQIWGFATILYFPQIYLYKAAYMNEALYDYYIHGNNLHITSEKNNLYILPKTYALVMDKLKLNQSEKEEVLEKVNLYVSRELLNIAFREYDKEEFAKRKSELQQLSGLRKIDIIKSFILSNSIIYNIFTKIWYKRYKL